MTTTKSQIVAADIAALLRARNPLLWVISREEARVESYLMEAAAAAGLTPHTWDVAQGAAGLDGKPERIGGQDPGAMLEAIRDRAMNAKAVTGAPPRDAWIMRDLPPWLIGPVGITTCRSLRNLCRMLPGVPRIRTQAIIILSPSGEVPPELSDHATVIEWPLPDRDEIAAILDAAVDTLPEYETNPKTGEPDTTKPLRALAAPNGVRDAGIDAAIGLTGEEAASCYAKSLVQLKRIDPVTITQEKKRVIARERVLEWLDPMPSGLNAVGGLENLKAWLVQRKLAYSPKARDYGLPSPKGVMMVGVPGGGKTLTAKSLAGEWGVPLLKLDMGALQSKYVGESQQNIRKAFRVIEAIGRCIVLIDEIEKALAGATQGAADGGVSSDALGTLLSWMQDRKTEAFVMATANNVDALPPELLRKGRFDEMFFVDLPNRFERLEVLQAALKSHGRSIKDLKAERIADVISVTEGFTGSEIAALVPEAMFSAFSDAARLITVDDLIAAANATVPLSKTAADKIDKLRDWAKSRARPATAIETVTERATARARQLDL